MFGRNIYVLSKFSCVRFRTLRGNIEYKDISEMWVEDCGISLTTENNSFRQTRTNAKTIEWNWSANGMRWLETNQTLNLNREQNDQWAVQPVEQN